MPKHTKRLTENEKGFYSLVAPELTNFITKRGQEEYLSKLRSAVLDKLGQLEDLEEKLGIDLITLLKALKDGYYYISNIGFGDGRIRFADHNTIELLPYDSGWLLHLSVDTRLVDACRVKDYGKTWALTKEELE